MKKNSAPKDAANKQSLKNNSLAAQRSRMLNQLRSLGAKGITTIECREQLNIMSPAPRVFELRELGYEIHTDWSNDTDHNGHTHRTARYILIDEPHEPSQQPGGALAC